MRTIITNFLLFILLVSATSASSPSIDFRNGRHNNVCKDLTKKSIRAIIEDQNLLAGQLFPDDIMTDVYARSLNDLVIGPFTSYMIGWTEELEREFEPLLTERFTVFK